MGARQEPRLRLNGPVQEDHRGHPAARQLRLERPFVELRVIERGDARGAPLHHRDETLLGDDDVLHIAELGVPDELPGDLRLAPHRVEWFVPQEKERDDVVHGVARVGQISRLERGANRSPDEIDRGGHRLRPEGSDSCRVLNLGSIGEEGVLLD
jgi:hypothetical protein